MDHYKRASTALFSKINPHYEQPQRHLESFLSNPVVANADLPMKKSKTPDTWLPRFFWSLQWFLLLAAPIVLVVWLLGGLGTWFFISLLAPLLLINILWACESSDQDVLVDEDAGDSEEK